MEIIQRGNKKLPKDRQARVYCDACGTLFRFAQHEGVVVFDQRDGDYVTVPCPSCGVSANVDLKLFE